MDEQQRLSNAYSELKDKYVALKRKIGNLITKLGDAERENARLWALAKKQHEQIGEQPTQSLKHIIQDEEAYNT